MVLGKLKDRIERIGRRILERGFAKVLPRDPNALTVSSLIITLPTPYLTWLHHYWAYILTFTLLIIAGAFDMLDGLIARYWGRASRLGAFLDSTLDRYVDFIALIDLWIVSDMNLLSTISLLLAVLGSLMTSYTRARAEALGIKMIGVGLLEREERLILILLILLIFIITGIGAVALYGLVLLALLTNITAIERIITVIRSLSSRNN
ncbi:CDP-alcohol phosphatidyltransferase family protein [Vulcanisaeta distributa]|uniref:CDP-alcohol phosphatidyltransferase family protein n=1 Tax=Vulcanisaeta distributa TaxID=164451 RepID=UPI0011E50C76|nr:CDP-alcohol phosphatidyltransferase family protein [Vulcanisaeta distributa]